MAKKNTPYRGDGYKYKAEFCDDIITQAKEGTAPQHASVDWDIDPLTVYDWRKSKPEFAAAWRKAKAAYTKGIVQPMFANMHNPKFNSEVSKHLLKYACRVDAVPGIDMKNKDSLQAADSVLESDDLTADERDRCLSAIEKRSRVHENTDVAKGLAEIQAHLKLNNKTRIKVVR